MNEDIERAIRILAKKITTSVQPDDALKYTQSALNMAHTKGVLAAHEAPPGKTKKANA